MQTIFITGAASGIGRATAELFASKGFFVGLYDVDQAGLDSLRLPSSCSGRLDVTDLDAFKGAVEAFGVAGGGRMDVLFNCAGILRMGAFDQVSAQDAHKEIAINVGGVVNGIYASLPLLEETTGSIIVNMSSASAIYGTPDHSVYSATKFAVRGLTEALELELRPRGIRVADVMPPYVATPMVHDQKIKSHMLETFGVETTAEDVAAVVWKAAQGNRVHWVMQNQHKAFIRLSGFDLARGLMRRFAKL
jgi:NAD(P)-dependent dehydrogenase (short-subunit alcohol dehydrogenase family)